MDLQGRLTLLAQRVAAELKGYRGRLLPSGGTAGQVLAKSSATDYATQWISRSIRMAFPCAGKPAAAEVFGPYVTDIPFTIPANLAGTIASAGTAPAASAVFTLKRNTATIGTLTIATTGAVTLATSGGTAVAILAGDRITITAPATQDSALADVGITLLGMV